MGFIPDIKNNIRFLRLFNWAGCSQNLASNFNKWNKVWIILYINRQHLKLQKYFLLLYIYFCFGCVNLCINFVAKSWSERNSCFSISIRGILKEKYKLYSSSSEALAIHKKHCNKGKLSKHQTPALGSVSEV